MPPRHLHPGKRQPEHEGGQQPRPSCRPGGSRSRVTCPAPCSARRHAGRVPARSGQARSPLRRGLCGPAVRRGGLAPAQGRLDIVPGLELPPGPGPGWRSNPPGAGFWPRWARATVASYWPGGWACPVPLWWPACRGRSWRHCRCFRRRLGGAPS